MNILIGILAYGFVLATLITFMVGADKASYPRER